MDITSIKPVEPAKGGEEFRSKAMALEHAILQIPGAQYGDNKECPLKHTFGDGCYIREIFMPAGMIVVSKIHKVAHPYFILRGDVSVATEQGSVRIKAPYHGITPAGTKRVLYIHEDTVWVTVHVTDKTDIDEIEEQIIAKDFDDPQLAASMQKSVAAAKEAKCLG